MSTNPLLRRLVCSVNRFSLPQNVVVESKCITFFPKKDFHSPSPPAKAFLVSKGLSGIRLKRHVSTQKEASDMRSLENVCWKCRATLTHMSKNFCQNCESILPIHKDENYFTLLGFKEDFRISLNELQFNFKKFQVLLHPDKFSLKSKLERQISENVSAILNKAYFTLAKPLSRGLYMLELHGVYMTEDVSTDNPELLDEIMNLNEQIANTSSTDEHKFVFNKVKAKVDNLTVGIAIAFNAKDIEAARELLITFKYYDNILQKLKELIPPA